MAEPDGTTCLCESSPEYISIKENFDKLVRHLGPSIISLGDMLFSNYLIPQDLLNSLKENSKPEARKVLLYLMDKIKDDPSVYHEFIDILQEHDVTNNMILEILAMCYKSQKATPESPSMTRFIKRRLSQRTIRLELTIPQDVPAQEKIGRVLQELVQVSEMKEDQVSLQL